MSDENERMRILQMIEDGQVSAAEGLRLLDALSEPEPAAPPPAAGSGDRASRAAEPSPDLERWRRWWVVPLWIGASVVLFGGLLMYWAYSASGFGLWFACAALPFALGVLIMALAAGSRSARWLHIRVKTGQDEWPRNIAVSFPLPIGLTAWALRTFGGFIPQLKEHGVDELIMALAENTSAAAPLYVDVQEDGAEHVQVYIG